MISHHLLGLLDGGWGDRVDQVRALSPTFLGVVRGRGKGVDQVRAGLATDCLVFQVLSDDLYHLIWLHKHIFVVYQLRRLVALSPTHTQ